MKTRLLYSVSFKLVILVTLFALISGVYIFYLGSEAESARIRSQAETALRQQMHQLQANLEYSFRLEDQARGQAIIGALGADASLDKAMVLDDRHRVIASLRISDQGAPLERALIKLDANLRAKILDMLHFVSSRHDGEVVYDAGNDMLAGIYPVLLGSEGDELRPSRYGSIVIVRSLVVQRQAMASVLAEQLIRFGAALFLLTVIIATVIHYIVSVRIGKLESAAKSYAGGDYTARARLAGNDELAVIGGIFDQMLGTTETALEELGQSEERVRLLLESSADAIVSVDLDGKCSFWNASTCHLFSVDPDQTIEGRLLPEILSSSYKNDNRFPDIAAILEEFRLGKQEVRGEFSLKHLQGDPVFIGYAGYPVLNRDILIGAMFVFTDVSVRKLAEQRIERLAHFDTLTELPNRSLFHDRMTNALVRAQRRNSLVAVLFMDLDGFKNINDTMGHSVGDKLLQQVASRLGDNVRLEDTVARLGGDEFTVILENVPDKHIAVAIANKIVAAMKNVFHVDGDDLLIGASVGLSLYPQDGDNIDTLLSAADTAMYEAKKLGRNQVVSYCRELTESALRKLEMEHDFRLAFQREEFILHFQPQLSLDGRLIGAEALVRWQHPDGRLIPPAEFLPIAREIGLATDLDAYVLRAACVCLSRWNKIFSQRLRVAINLSGVQINDGSILDTVREAMADTDIEASCLELEITEEFVISNPDRAIAVLKQLKEIGVSLAIDDFGTGHSSLAYLKQLPVDRLKIDRSFIRDIHKSMDDQAIVSAIIAMARRFSLDIIAEGVEQREQITILEHLGCETVQGYFISRPLPPSQFERQLKQGFALGSVTRPEAIIQ